MLDLCSSLHFLPSLDWSAGFLSFSPSVSSQEPCAPWLWFSAGPVLPPAALHLVLVSDTEPHGSGWVRLLRHCPNEVLQPDRATPCSVCPSRACTAAWGHLRQASEGRGRQSHRSHSACSDCVPSSVWGHRAVPCRDAALGSPGRKVSPAASLGSRGVEMGVRDSTALPALSHPTSCSWMSIQSSSSAFHLPAEPI